MQNLKKMISRYMQEITALVVIVISSFSGY